MSEAPNTITASAARARMADGSLTPGALVEACRLRIADREETVQAWATLDPAAIEAELARVEAIPEAERGPLWGLPVAVKDIFDTADLPTSYGSPIHAGHRPARDAACVARLRAAGAVVLGKTVTTEFAFLHAGVTRNPLDPTRTPGGSSSGSAAAVADRMVPLALGSQTAASTIRPASFCGIVGFKPTLGLISTEGVKGLSGSFDTVGAFARSVADAALLAGVMADLPSPPAAAPQGAIARWHGAEWEAADATTKAVIETALSQLAAAGATIDSQVPPPPFDGITALQLRVMGAEAARELAHETRTAPDKLSEKLRALLIEGAALPAEQRMADRVALAAMRADLEPLFGGAALLAAPASMGEAVPIEQGTGNPDTSRGFTALGLPSITIPSGHGPSGLPLGLQLVARHNHDAMLLAAAAWAEAVLTADRSDRE
ncbi:MAG: amidase [Pseudomonadota bacterium]